MGDEISSPTTTGAKGAIATAACGSRSWPKTYSRELKAKRKRRNVAADDGQIDQPAQVVSAPTRQGAVEGMPVWLAICSICSFIALFISWGVGSEIWVATIQV